MAKDIFEPGITVSLLDRLTDNEPRVATEPPWTRAQSLRQLKASLRRDLEFLLNARRTPIDPPPSARELPRSVYAFGLPDITGMAIDASEDQHRLARAMEAAIAIFEPRLANVSVAAQPAPGAARILRFRIEGTLRVDPAPERVFFDTALHLTSATYEVEGEKRAG
ncbi:MAG: type VI secretion system baseplate subunit TssE [Bryobacteraceae bacterium]|nr:type VI secretion system baseplate subunit TssE [Bryobacteraceae bacterium]